MNDTTAKDKPLNDSLTGISFSSKLVNNLFDQAHQVMMRYNRSIEAENQNQAVKMCESDRSIRLQRTAGDIEIIKQMLIRRINVNQTTDRSTEKLICQFKIQTNRLMVLLDEYDEEISEIQSDVKLDNIAI